MEKEKVDIELKKLLQSINNQIKEFEKTNHCHLFFLPNDATPEYRLLNESVAVILDGKIYS